MARAGYDEIELDGIRFEIDGEYYHRLCRLIAFEDADAHGETDDRQLILTEGDALYENGSDEELIRDVIKAASRNLRASGLQSVNSWEIGSYITELEQIQEELREADLETMVTVGLCLDDGPYICDRYELILRDKPIEYVDLTGLIERTTMLSWLSKELSFSHVKISNIRWDTYGEDVPGLPDEIVVPACPYDNKQDLVQYLSDTYCFPVVDLDMDHMGSGSCG